MALAQTAGGSQGRGGWRSQQCRLAGLSGGLRFTICASRRTRCWPVPTARRRTGRPRRSGARERATAVRLRGIGHQLKTDYPAAIAAYREALDLLAQLVRRERGRGHRPERPRRCREAAPAISRRRSGIIARRCGWPARSITPRAWPTITGNLAALALDRKDWPGAETLAREALALSEKLGRQELIADDCHRLAKALVRQGKAAEALPYARRAVEIYTRLGSPQTSKPPARRCESASLDRPFGLRNWNPAADRIRRRAVLAERWGHRRLVAQLRPAMASAMSCAESFSSAGLAVARAIRSRDELTQQPR